VPAEATCTGFVLTHTKGPNVKSTPRHFEVIDDDCIGCGLCSERAPENMEIPNGTAIAQVFKQPENSEEEEACLEALDYCPMGGIHEGAEDSTTDDSTPTDSSMGGTRPSSIPAGDSTPADST